VKFFDYLHSFVLADKIMLQSSTERRQYFRVNDSVGVRYRLVDDESSDFLEKGLLLSDEHTLVELEQQILAAMEPLRSSHPQIMDILSLFNQKINLAFDLSKSADDGLSRHVHKVNLSACGISFPVEDRLSLNQPLFLELLLYPSHVSMRLLASVIGCEMLETPSKEEEFLLRANFVDISESDQEVLVQHVIHCQSVQLKHAREIREMGS